MNKLLPLALRTLRRHFRAGELHLLVTALVLAVASMTSVGFLSDRIGGALEREANQLLGGDLLLSADHPWSEDFAQEARRRGLNVVTSRVFPSIVSHGEAMAITSIKAAETGYPLRGAQRITDRLDGPETAAKGIPAPGTVWLDEKLVTTLSAQPGEKVRLGLSHLTVAAILTFDADRGGSNFLSFMPRLMMNQADLPATGLVREGSRITYRLHFAGEPETVAQFQTWAKAHLGRGERIEDVANARPELRAALEKAKRYLHLSALLAVILAAVAVGLAARRFVERHLDGCAVMRCLGAQQRQIFLLFVLEFVFLGLAASLLGSLVGYLVQEGLARLLNAVMGLPLPIPSWLPAAQGAMIGLVLVAGFVLPPLLRLGQVSTLRVLRREWLPTPILSLTGWGSGFAAVAGLMFWMAEDVRLAAILCGGMALAIAVYWLLAWVLLGALSRIRLGTTGGWQLGLAALRRRRNSMAFQSVALAVGLTALLVLTLTRDDLLSAWRQNLPAQAPNRFAINIQPEELEAVRQFFISESLTPPSLLPMVRGRLIEINRQPVKADRYQEQKARNLAEREFNLSWSSELPTRNFITAGQWFDRETGGFSVERGLAKTLGLNLGDELAFNISGHRVEGKITSVRKLEWDSMRINFFVITPPGVLEAYPTSYVASFHLSASQEGFGRRLANRFPGMTLVDASAVLDQLQTMVMQLSRAVQAIFLFTLAAGLLVLWAALEASVEERAAETALLRALGARHRQIRQALLVEFALLGLIAGSLAVLGAGTISWALAHFALYLDYVPSPLLLSGALFLSVIGIALIGVLGLSSTLKRPVVEVLRAG